MTGCRVPNCEPDHEFYAGGGGFVWGMPVINWYRSAKRHTGAGLNRYPHNVIGAYVSIAGRALGIRWKFSRRSTSA